TAREKDWHGHRRDQTMHGSLWTAMAMELSTMEGKCLATSLRNLIRRQASNETDFWLWLNTTNHLMAVMATGKSIAETRSFRRYGCGRTRTTTEFRKRRNCTLCLSLELIRSRLTTKNRSAPISMAMLFA